MSQGVSVEEARMLRVPKKIMTPTLCVLVFILNMDITIANVALPSLSSLPDATDAKLQWVIASYALAAAIAVIPSGALLDRYGPRWVLTCAALLFGVASLAAALSPSTTAVIVSRVVMGLGSSAILTGSIATLTLHYQDRKKARAFGLWSACAAIGLSVGPLVGGWLLSVATWEAIFLVNVPLSLFAAAAVASAVPASKGLNESRLDIKSIFVLSLVLLTGIAGLIELGAGRVPSSILMATCCVLFLVLFLVRQQGAGPKLIDFKVLRSGTMLAPLFILVVLFTVMAVMLFLLPSSFELGLGRGPLVSSFYILPLPLGIAAATLLGGYVLHSLPATASMWISLTAVAVGLLVVMSQDPTIPSSVTLIGLACVGIGVGIGQPVALQAAVGAFPPAQRGVGSGFVNSVRLAANAAGAAIAGGAVALTMAGTASSLGTYSLVDGASSCRVLRAANSLADAGGLCATYLNGVKLTFLLAFVLVAVAVLAISIRAIISRQGRAAAVSTNNAQE